MLYLESLLTIVLLLTFILSYVNGLGMVAVGVVAV
jgi:hypothetical protein